MNDLHVLLTAICILLVLLSAIAPDGSDLDCARTAKMIYACTMASIAIALGLWSLA